MRKLVLALVAGAACGAVQAQSTQFPRYYVGASANFADHEYQIPGASNIHGDGYEAGYKIFGGADIDPIWGAEAGYTDFSKSRFNYTQNGLLPGRGEVDGYGVYFAGKARWPVHPMVDVYGKLGVAYSHRKLSSDIPLTARRNNDDTGVYAGVGVQWNVTPQWAVVGEYERYGRSKPIGSSADVFTIGARYNF